jgi:hypothetical protein
MPAALLGSLGWAARRACAWFESRATFLPMLSMAGEVDQRERRARQIAVLIFIVLGFSRSRA